MHRHHRSRKNQAMAFASSAAGSGATPPVVGLGKNKLPIVSPSEAVYQE
jgi:hypothetical protein